MRRKILLFSALALLVGLAPGWFAESAEAQVDIHVVMSGDTMKSAFLEIRDDQQLRLGERIAFRARLFDASGSTEVGRTRGDCVVMSTISPEFGSFVCTYVLMLADGDLVIEGLYPRARDDYEMAVLSGTGAYAGVTGDATFTTSNVPPEDTNMQIRLMG